MARDTAARTASSVPCSARRWWFREPNRAAEVRNLCRQLLNTGGHGKRPQKATSDTNGYGARAAPPQRDAEMQAL